MQILVHHHKYGDNYYDAEDEAWAFYQMFKVLDEFQAYEQGLESPKDISDYARAKDGDRDAAMRLCKKRGEWEYEGFELVDVNMKPGPK